MTLLDAPVFNEARERRRRVSIFAGGGLLLALIVGWWLVAGMPVDWPWNWNNHLFGRSAVNGLLTAVEQNDMPKAYGIWVHDKNWQQHPAQYGSYPFERFQQDLGPASNANEYGPIHSHKIAAERMYGNVLMVAVLINGRKSKALNLDYDPKTHKLNYSPEGVELSLKP